MKLTMINAKDWQKLPTEHFMNSITWARLKSTNNWHDTYYTHGKHRLLLLVRKEKWFKVGQIVLTWKISKADLKEICQQIQSQHQLDLLQVDIRCKQDYSLSSLRFARKSRQVQPRATGISNISKVDENISQLKRKIRYLIRSASNKGITIDIVEPDSKQFDRFWRLYLQTSRSKGFILRPKSYYQKLMELTTEPKSDVKSVLTFARYKKEDISAAYTMYSGETAWLLYAAHSTKHKNIKPNNLLQTENMKYLNNLGIKTYDWWGASYPEDNKNDPMYTVWQFKKSMGAEYLAYPGTYDVFGSSLKSKLFFIIYQTRNYILDIKKSKASNQPKTK